MSTLHKDILHALRIVHMDGPTDTNSGICYNTRILLQHLHHEDETYTALEEASIHWPKFSGNKVYPIPGGKQAFMRDLEHDSFWDNPDRHALLAFLITYFSEHLE